MAENKTVLGWNNQDNENWKDKEDSQGNSVNSCKGCQYEYEEVGMCEDCFSSSEYKL